MTFEDCLKIILEHEGGYVNHPSDPGGETKYGISKRMYPNLDIFNLTEEKAAHIYKMDYWDKIKGDNLSPAIRLLVFDCAVNQGVPRAIKFMQQVVGVIDDGVFGPVTQGALEDVSDSDFVRLYAFKRLDHYTGLKTWEKFGRGWSKRLIDVAMMSAFFVGFEMLGKE